MDQETKTCFGRSSRHSVTMTQRLTARDQCRMDSLYKGAIHPHYGNKDLHNHGIPQTFIYVHIHIKIFHTHTCMKAQTPLFQYARTFYHMSPRDRESAIHAAIYRNGTLISDTPTSLFVWQ